MIWGSPTPSGSYSALSFILGADLRIKRFTPAATRLFNLIVSDVGRPIGDLTARCADPALQADMAAVLQDLSPRETEVLSEDGRWYIRRILPYRMLAPAEN